MSYVQGTVVRLEGRFEKPDPDNPLGRIPFDPTEVLLTVDRPDNVREQFTLSAGTITREAAGVYTHAYDTSHAVGTYDYQFENPGAERSVQRKELTVHPRIG